MYGTRWGDDLERLSERFLVPQSALLAQNPELSAPTSVTYSPDAQGANTQVCNVAEWEGAAVSGKANADDDMPCRCQ
jgi:hypothetical protein